MTIRACLQTSVISVSNCVWSFSHTLCSILFSSLPGCVISFLLAFKTPRIQYHSWPIHGLCYFNTRTFGRGHYNRQPLWAKIQEFTNKINHFKWPIKRRISHLIFYSKYSPKKAYIKRTLGGKYSVYCVGTQLCDFHYR